MEKETNYEEVTVMSGDQVAANIALENPPIEPEDSDLPDPVIDEMMENTEEEFQRLREFEFDGMYEAFFKVNPHFKSKAGYNNNSVKGIVKDFWFEKSLPLLETIHHQSENFNDVVELCEERKVYIDELIQIGHDLKDQRDKARRVAFWFFIASTVLFGYLTTKL